MNRSMRLLIVAGILLVLTGPLGAAEWYASTDGKPDAAGAQSAPWDLESALSGKQKITPGDTLWVLAGAYKHPDRKLGAAGYAVRLAGEKDRPIEVRAARGARVTLDGGLAVQQPATWLWIRDLEIIVSENLTMSRRVEEPGSHPESYKRPWGGLNVHSGEGCKFINLVIHDNAQGISWWTGSTNSEVHGCIIYDNGWDAPDRGHGHAIYTQNQNGVKTISDCIMTGGHSYTMHAYGSSRAYVDNYLIESNIAYNAGPFLIGGGRPSHGIRALKNLLYNVNVQIGYSAPENEDCEVRDNVIVHGGLSINKYKKVVEEGNLVVGKSEYLVLGKKDAAARVELRPNRYDPDRANVAIFNWAKKPTVTLPPVPFLKPGDRYRLMNPRDFFGKPVLAGTFEGKDIAVPVDGEFAALVLLREAPH